MAEPSAFVVALDCVMRIVTGDFSQFYEDSLFLLIGISFFVSMWLLTYYTLMLSTKHTRTRSLIRPQAVSVESRNIQIAVAGNPEELIQNENVEIIDVPVAPNDFQPQENSPNADYRAAGDGWEGDEDADYIIDQNMIFSEDDSDDDAAILRRIIEEANNITSNDPVVVIPDFEEEQPQQENEANEEDISTEEAREAALERFEQGRVDSIIDDADAFSDGDEEYVPEVELLEEDEVIDQQYS